MILKTAKPLLVTGVSTFKGDALWEGDSCLEEAKWLRHTYSANLCGSHSENLFFPRMFLN